MFWAPWSFPDQIFYMGMQNVQKLKKCWSRIFDSHLRIKDMALWVSPMCLYREAMHLQCFSPTHYVRARRKSDGPLPFKSGKSHCWQHIAALNARKLLFFCLVLSSASLLATHPYMQSLALILSHSLSLTLSHAHWQWCQYKLDLVYKKMY